MGLTLTAIVLVSLVVVAQRGYSPPADAVAIATRGPIEGYWWPEIAVRDTYANWATTLIAFLGLAISVIGVFLVRATFVETRRTAEAAITSNETARRLGEAQVRAYISWDGAVRGAAHLAGSGADERVAIVFTPVIKNTGQSPGNIRLLYTELLVVPIGEELPRGDFPRLGAEVDHDLGAGNLFNLVERHIHLPDVDAVHRREKRCLLFGYGEYRDVFWQSEKDTHSLRFCFEVFFNLPSSHPDFQQFIDNIRLINVPAFQISPVDG